MSAPASIVTNLSSISQNVILVWYEHSNPLAEVDRILKAPPHADGYTFIVPNLQPVLYNFKIYESSDGATLETLLFSFSMQPKQYKSVLQVFDYIVDRGEEETDPAAPYWKDPVSTETECVDERFKNAVSVSLERDGGAVMIEGVHFNLLAEGGWGLLGYDEFSPDEKWKAFVIHMEEVDSTGVSSSDYSDIQLVSVDEEFGADYYNKNNIADGVEETTFPAFNTIPNRTKARFSNHLGVKKYWALRFEAGDTVHYEGEDREVIYLLPGESIELFWKAGICYVLNDKTFYHQVGKRDLVDKVNTDRELLTDGTQYNIADEPRIAEWIQTLGAGQSTNVLATWNANKHLWYIDTVGGVFNVPDDRDMHYRSLKTFDGVNGVPGTYQEDQVGEHKHELPVAATNTPNGPLVYTRAGARSPGPAYTETYGEGNETAVKAVRQFAVVRI